jgi:hypothetical protein
VYTVPESQRADLRSVRLTSRGWRGDYNQDELGRAVNKAHLVGSILDHWRRYALGRAAVCFAVNLEHGEHIASEFRAHGVAAEQLTSDTRVSEREQMLQRLRSGATRVIVNCSVLTEGWDAPEVKLAIVARPTMSRVLWMQMAGRITRPHEHTPIVLDHAGNALVHGVPLEDEEFSLQTLPIVRRKGHAEWSEKICPECGAAVRVGARICAFCAHEFWEVGLPEEAAGALVLARPRLPTVMCTYAKCPRPDEPINRSGQRKGRTGATWGMHFECIIAATKEARRCANPDCPTPDKPVGRKARQRGGNVMHKSCRAASRVTDHRCYCGAPLRKLKRKWQVRCDDCRKAKHAEACRLVGVKMKGHWLRDEYIEAMRKRRARNQKRCERCGEPHPGGHRFHAACWEAMSTAERAAAMANSKTGA